MRASLVLATSTGGIGTHVASLVDRLPGLGVDVTVVCPAATEEQFGFETRGAGFIPVDMATVPRPREDLAAVRALRESLVDVDVVHTHGLRATSLAALALGRRRPGRNPLVATWHNAVLGSGIRRWMLVGLELLSARRADVTLGASADLVARAARMGAPVARFLPVAAPTMPPPTRDRADVRTELGVDDRPLLVAVGRLASQKDYGTLLDAAASWQARSPRPMLAIAGDGPERDRLQHVIDTRGLYLLTSTWEARALVVQEAMRAGVPVVATAVGGVPELAGDAAVLVPPADAAAVARAVVDLLNDETRRDELARRGRERASSWPDEDDTAREVAAIYRQLAQE
jgi:glycosyltransferase involved in cell wall biosynthesis